MDTKKKADPCSASRNKSIIPKNPGLSLIYQTRSQEKSNTLWARCRQELEEVKVMPESQWFLRPIDWRELKMPLYPNIIKKPMDLGTIGAKLGTSEYSDIFEFNRDVELVWSNARIFNSPRSRIFDAAGFLARTWRQRFSKLRIAPTLFQKSRLRKKNAFKEKNAVVTDCENKVPKSTQGVMGTDGHSKCVRPNEKKKPEGISRSVSGASPSMPSLDKSSIGMDILEDRDITVSPLCSAIPGVETTTKMDFVEERPARVENFSVPYMENMSIDETVLNPRNIVCSSIGNEKVFSGLVPHLVNANGTVNEKRVMEMSLNQLLDLGNKIGIVFPQKGSIAERQKQTIFRLEWLRKQSIVKAHSTSSWVPPKLGTDKTQMAQCFSENKISMQQKTILSPSLKKQSSKSKAWREVEVLRAENARLLSRLKKSESLRREIMRKLNQSQNRRSIKDELEIMTNKKWTRNIRVNEDDQAGLLFDLHENVGVLQALDNNLAGRIHASKNRNEIPVATFSENELETVSYPFPKEMAAHLRKINDIMQDNTNMVGHIEVPQKRVEVSGDFGGVKGNLIWFNSGETALLLKLETELDTRSILLKPGFGFCLGKRERYIRVFLSSIEKVEVLFMDGDSAPQRAHAIFFGSDRGDRESWRGALNCATPGKGSRLPGMDSTNIEKEDGAERYRRLGVEPMNNKRNHIRIAPVKDCSMKKDFLLDKVDIVEKWIRNSLSQAKLIPTPIKFTVSKETEQPQVGKPFEVLWAKFQFDENNWNDEVMWDIRYLLMGSKMDRLPGFPSELNGVRDCIYISRDGISEGKRRRRRL